MALGLDELLRKAVLDISDGTAGAPIGGGDFGGSGEAALSIEQVTQFLEIMAAEQVMLSDVRTVTSAASKWNESILLFADRVARPGIEATRLLEVDRIKPGTSIVEISTVLLRGEVPVSDETLEDNVAGGNIVGSIQRTLADKFGFDVEELLVNGDTTSGDPYLALLNGWLYQAVNGKYAATGPQAPNVVVGGPFGKDYQAIFKAMLQTMPKRYLRGLKTSGRYYVPVVLEQGWRDILSSRGTPLGDLYLTTDNELRYQGIIVKGVPTFDLGITDDDECTILLAHKENLYAGWHRSIKFESFRDPREGATSFLVTARVDAEIAVVNATVAATGVDVSID